MEYKQRKWQIWVDTGGTFTDCIAQHPDGQMLRAKVLSSSHLRGQLLEREGPAVYHFTHQWPVEEDIFRGYKFKFLEKPEENLTIEYIDFSRDLLKLNRDISLNKVQSFEITSGEEAPVLAARIVTKTPLNKNFPALSMRLGSTKGTNALLEKKGAKVALLITRGFKDLVPIGNQQRPDLFQLNIPEPVLLYDRVFEVEERIGAQGEILQPLEVTELSSLIASFQKVKPEAVAVALMHSYRNPKHEQELKRALKKAKIPFISLSQELTPAIKFLPRTQTALVNAYLSPAIQQYLDHVYDGLVGDEGNKNASLLIMSSVGGLVSKASFRPKDSLLSGPAGGVVGAAVIAQQLGYSKVLTLDMGGTSTDAARYDGQYDYQYITKIAGIEMLSPSLSIETVAAGGGSICGFDGNKLRVGPESAGAMPGPACYGAGGPLTLTDVNLLLGKLETSSMGIPVHQSKAELEIKRLQEKIKLRTGIDYSIPELLEGFEKIADEKMADAIRKISIAKGFDPENYALLAFGGAGGLHACGVAEQLKIDTIILPFDAGLLSAYGMGMARVERMVQQQVLKKYTLVQDQLSDIVQQLYEQAKQLLLAEGFEEKAVEKIATLVYLRFKGQESCLEINFTGPGDLPAQFREKYIGLFGHYPIQQELEVESVKVIMASKVDMPERNMHSPKKHYPKPDNLHQAAFSGEATPLYYWDKLKEGAIVAGPAILLNNTSTVYVANGWTLEVTTDKNALLRFQRVESQQAVQLKEAIALELFTNRFSAIAEEMGAQLQRTAFSVNIKERLDFSCAILDANAQLLVNAPHIPVHLGSLGICARLVLEKLPLNPGDVIITNHPKYGGSHLPDVTLIMAVYTDENELIGYVINRAHHAEIGGKRPGSMPPDAQTLAEEGVVIQPTYLVKNNELQWPEIENLLNEGPYPSRSVNENLADINAALAALRSGAQALQALVRVNGREKVHHYMKRLRATTQEALQIALKKLGNHTFIAKEKLDDGHLIAVEISIKDGLMNFDFSGTSAVHPYNLNANLSIVFSAVLYVLRLLCGRAIPLNEGLMENVRLHLPAGFLNPDFSDDGQVCPAVVGGNTEVSQRLVDTLIKAFGLAACSQGTMNNFLFGNEKFGYYETICGGVGAGEGFHGRSAVHQHMTNTRITDPEELELRFPVRLHQFAIRPNSGGKGQWNGGNGVIREVEFLEKVDITILSQHRIEAPYGVDGGKPGKTGRQTVLRKEGKEEVLKGSDSTTAYPGDRIRIETPGGGAWGKGD